MRPRSVRGRPGRVRTEVFVLPQDRSSPSGGNLYNSSLLKALKMEGFAFRVMTLDQALGYAGRGGRARYWVDSLHFAQLEDPVKRSALGPEMFLIIHHLASFEPGLDPEERRRRTGQEKPVLQAAAGYLATGPLAERVLRRRGNPAAPVFVVRPALAVVPSGRKPAGTGFAGLIVSNLISRKGVLEFLGRLGPGMTGSDSLTIRIAGRSDIEPAYAAACLREIRRHPRLEESVRYLGPMPPGRMRSVYESGTVFISPSRVETYGMAFHEAMAFGLPVLAVRAPYAEPHIEPGKNGFLYPTIGGLTRGCLGLARDREELARLREAAWNARARVKYGWRDAARLFIRELRAFEKDCPEVNRP